MSLLTDVMSQLIRKNDIKFWYVHALSDTDLVEKLLPLDATATTAKMLKVCHTHIAIADNLNAMNLIGSKSVSEVQGQHLH